MPRHAQRRGLQGIYTALTVHTAGTEALHRTRNVDKEEEP